MTDHTKHSNAADRLLPQVFLPAPGSAMRLLAAWKEPTDFVGANSTPMAHLE
jgi:hypothetical protein